MYLGDLCRIFWRFFVTFWSLVLPLTAYHTSFTVNLDAEFHLLGRILIVCPPHFRQIPRPCSVEFSRFVINRMFMVQYYERIMVRSYPLRTTTSPRCLHITGDVKDVLMIGQLFVVVWVFRDVYIFGMFRKQRSFPLDTPRSFVWQSSLRWWCTVCGKLVKWTLRSVFHREPVRNMGSVANRDGSLILHATGPYLFE